MGASSLSSEDRACALRAEPAAQSQAEPLVPLRGPLAIDLCCGLSEPEFRLGADAAVKQLVARRAEHPKHVTLGVADERPRPVPRKLGLVRYLQDAALAAAFASCRNVRVSPAHSVELGVLVRSAGVVSALARRIAASPNPTQFAGRLAGAISRAVPLVGAGRNNVEMRSAARAILSGGGDIGLLASAAAPSATGAWRGAIEFIRPYGLKCCGAFSTGQIIHSGAIA